ncbi:HAD family acid phosphatase [Streptomyces sp. NPDC048241]|uniref:HAD family acid phosphatase n=1 Tax=Streptomyces sp. NPDC048241 TaxID=3365521 RepID=UPI00371157D6
MTRRPWARRTAAVAVSTAALTALAAPAEAAPTATTVAAAVDYATWQRDCGRVMDEALPYIQSRAASSAIEKQAIVLDVDNTTLETDFGFQYPQPANRPVLKVAQYAQDHGVALFFVTARPGILHWPTSYNLEHDGYRVTDLRVRGLLDLFKDVAAYKTAQRADIERQGYAIIANIGNSTSDLTGGHAEKTFKLPDYDGQLS